MSETEKFQMVDDQINHLYFVLLEYYTLLKNTKHCKINLIAELLDELIRIKKLENKADEEYRKLFIAVNTKAFETLNGIYEYDKKMKEKEEKEKEEKEE